MQPGRSWYGVCVSVGIMKTPLTVAIFLSLLTPIAACSSEGSSEDVGANEGAATAGPGATTAGLKIPPPGKAKAELKGVGANGPDITGGVVISPADQAAIVDRWKFVQKSFYGTQSGYSKVSSPAPLASETENCFAAVPNYYSELVSHFYCWHPSYLQVVPNVRGCFSNIARGRFPNVMSTYTEKATKTTPAHEQPRRLFYPEIYDYCLFEEFDAVLKPSATPDYDARLIAANKSAGKKPGVLKWVDDNEADVFKFIMFTEYDPFTYSIESQQAIINRFYGTDDKGTESAELTTINRKPKYTVGDAAQVAACRKMRPVTANDPTDPKTAIDDGTHCSISDEYKADYVTQHVRKPTEKGTPATPATPGVPAAGSTPAIPPAPAVPAYPTDPGYRERVAAMKDYLKTHP
jgi:hypothetical protein